MHKQQHPEIGQQNQRQPFQDRRIATIGNKQLQGQRHNRKANGHSMRVQPDDHLRNCAHHRKICADVDRVGDEQHRHHGHDKGRRKDLAHVGRQSDAGHTTDIGADQLDCAHQRVCQKQRPQQPEPGLRAGLRICGDAAGIVVGGAGDQAWAQLFGQGDGAKADPDFHAIAPLMPVPIMTDRRVAHAAVCGAAIELS
jgi:hypothetical protein